MRGKLSAAEYHAECLQLRDYLKAEAKPHFDEFLAAWL